MHAPEISSASTPLQEAHRTLALCNICGYCNGYCPVFDAASARPALQPGDLAWLAHLCHGCRNCLEACQYAPPHAFAINVPRTLERLRWHDYGARVWPAPLAHLLRAPPRALLSALLAAMLLPWLLALLWLPWPLLTRPALAAGDFYRILPFEVMVTLGTLTLGWALVSITISLAGFWRAIGSGRPSTRISAAKLAALLWDIVSLRHLNGGGPGCRDSHTRLAPARRWLHQILLLGLLGCLAATLIAAYWHHLLDLPAPYPADSLPVRLGLFGGLAMLSAGIGLAWIRRRTHPLSLAPEASRAIKAALAILLAVIGSGLALLAWRATPAMGALLLAHLGAVFFLFLWLPASTLVHGGYRLLALLRLRLDPPLTHP